jgi:corrinoid protein of di/trimethylamine methyltransferase
MASDFIAQIRSSIIDGEPDKTTELIQEALSSSLEPMEIIDKGLMPGMNVVGEKFARGEYFLPNLVIAGTAMQNAMKLLEPELAARKQTLESSGTVVIGTVRGDIHEIGKSLVAIMLRANGFAVHDLGVNVSNETFIAKIKETEAELIGLSALITTTMTVQREIIEALIGAGIRQQVKVMVGGTPVTSEWAESIGADGYAEDAMSAVTLAKRLMELDS